MLNADNLKRIPIFFTFTYSPTQMQLISRARLSVCLGSQATLYKLYILLGPG
jgi:hypothetical protein